MFKVGDRVRVLQAYAENGDGNINWVGKEATILRTNMATEWPIEAHVDGEAEPEHFKASELELVPGEDEVQVIAEKPNFLPEYKSAGAAGADLKAAEALVLEPGERRLVRTGVRFAIPPHLYGKIEDRSGWAANHGITTLAGVIDPDFRGEVRVVLLNTGSFPLTIAEGDRIAQIVFKPFVQVDFTPVEALPDTERGEGGFGSTGVVS